MEVKFGKVKPKAVNMFMASQVENADDNFFVAGTPTQKQESQAFLPSTRLNDFDSNILENAAYQAMPDELFKLEHKIEIQEKTLAKLNNEINALESLNADIQISDLKSRKKLVEQELEMLNNQYSKFGLSSKISGQIASVVSSGAKKKPSIFSQAKKFLAKKVFAKCSKKIGQSQTIKEALDNLNSINESVDELIRLQVPYGETINRYEKLTAYLNKANGIQAKITKDMNLIVKRV